MKHLSSCSLFYRVTRFDSRDSMREQAIVILYLYASTFTERNGNVRENINAYEAYEAYETRNEGARKRWRKEGERKAS